MLSSPSSSRLAKDGSDALTITRTREDREDDGSIYIRCGNEEVIIAQDLLRLKDMLKDYLESNKNIEANSNRSLPATEVAIPRVRRVTSVSGATELIPTTSARVDAVTYIEPG